MDIGSISKAVAGGIIALIVGELARFGFHPSNEVITAGGLIITGLISYVVGHIAVYIAPANKPK